MRDTPALPREEREVRAPDPALPDDVTFSLLDRDVRGRLRTLSKENADRVGRHLVMVGRLLDDEPEAAYEHAQAAVRRAGRVDVVREAAGLAAYRTGRYAEALRELRTVRRLNGSSEHLAIMADAERGLGRPERALTLSHEPEAAELAPETQVELAIVVSGARLDLGQPEAAVAALAAPVVRAATGLAAARVAQARAAALEAAGRPADAAAELAGFAQDVLDEAAGGSADHEDVVVYDLFEDPEAQIDNEQEGADGSLDERRSGDAVRDDAVQDDAVQDDVPDDDVTGPSAHEAAAEVAPADEATR